MSSHNLRHRAAAAVSAIDNAKSPLEKHVARQDALAVKTDLEKQLGDDAAMAAFKKAKPQNSHGVWKGDVVTDHPVFMTGPAGTKITAPILMPDGSYAAPNPQGQITVPASFVVALMARGFVRANDSAITELKT